MGSMDDPEIPAAGSSPPPLKSESAPPPVPESPPSLPSKVAEPPKRNGWWLNLCTWSPFLASPPLKEVQVKFLAREGRDGTSWQVSLPRQCWRCATTDGLRQRTFERDVRSYDMPLAIVGAALVCFLSFCLLSMMWGALFMLALLSLVGGAAMLFVKSWTERVALTMSTCDEHADAIQCPDIVLYDNELILFLASEKAADAARQELLARRRAAKQGGASAAPAPTPRAAEPRIKLDDGPPLASGPAPEPRRSELPPIKLDE